jgi:hypothetical protein
VSEGYRPEEIETYVNQYLLEEIFDSGIVHEAIYRHFSKRYGHSNAAKIISGFSLIENQSEQMSLVAGSVEQLLQLLPGTISAEDIPQLDAYAKRLRVNPRQLKELLRKLKELKASDPELYSLKTSLYSILFTEDGALAKYLSERDSYRAKAGRFFAALLGRAAPTTALSPQKQSITSWKDLILEKTTFFKSEELDNFLKNVNDVTKSFFIAEHLNEFSPRQLVEILSTYSATLYPELKARLTSRIQEFSKINDLLSDEAKIQAEITAVKKAQTPGRVDMEMIRQQFEILDRYVSHEHINDAIGKILGAHAEEWTSVEFHDVCLLVLTQVNRYTDGDSILWALERLQKTSRKVKISAPDLKDIRARILKQSRRFNEVEYIDEIVAIANSPDWGAKQEIEAAPKVVRSKDELEAQLAQINAEIEAELARLVQKLSPTEASPKESLSPEDLLLERSRSVEAEIPPSPEKLSSERQ